MRPAPRWLQRGLGIGFLLLIVWQGWYLGWVMWWKWVDPWETSFQSRRLDEMQEKNPQARLSKTWMPYEQLSVHLKRAVVAAEDDKFVDHEGFDWEGMQKAQAGCRCFDHLAATGQKSAALAQQDRAAQGRRGTHYLVAGVALG